MPRPGMRPPGIESLLAVGLVALALTGCSALEPQPQVSQAPPSPSPSSSGGAAWVEDLRFTGDLQGTLNQVIPGFGSTRSACTGRRGQTATTWVLTIFGLVGKDVYGVTVTVSGYRGPGTYAAPQADVQVFRPDNSAGWRVGPGDQVTFTVGADQESGQLNAILTNLANDQTKLRLSGSWSCRT